MQMHINPGPAVILYCSAFPSTKVPIVSTRGRWRKETEVNETISAHRACTIVETRRCYIKNMSFIVQELLQRIHQMQVRGEKSSGREEGAAQGPKSFAMIHERKTYTNVVLLTQFYNNMVCHRRSSGIVNQVKIINYART